MVLVHGKTSGMATGAQHQSQHTAKSAPGAWQAIALLAAVITQVFSTIPSAHAATKYAAMTMDANTGKILHSRHGDKQRYPASLTKMMTLYMVFDLIEKKRLSYGSKIRISAQAASQPPSKLGLKVGSTIKVSDAAKALVTKSANDIAVAIAEHIAGSEANFARLMTKKARDLGMSSTTFKNASGLPNSQQKTTARDMLTLALALQDNHPGHYKIFKTRRFSYGGKTYKNHNALLGRVQGVDGIKTGYIRAAGFNLVTSVRKNGKHVVAAVFGGKSSRARNATMRSLISSGLKRASTRKTRRARPQLIARPKRVSPQKRTALRTTRPSPRRSAPAPSRAPIINTVANIGRPSADQTNQQKRSSRPRSKPTIQIAQVKRVSVLSTRANLGAQNRTLSSPSPQPISVTRAGLPPITPQPLQRKATPSISNNGAPGRQPSTLQDQLANLLANSGVAQNQLPKQRFNTAQRGQGQTFAPRYRPATASANRSNKNGRYHVQIGAYNSQSEAVARLTQIAAREEQLLSGYSRLAVPVQSGQRRLYRARFAGFSAATASKTCTELRRRSVDCFVASNN
ncbi:MAG: SPOR domain-containing protein [Pseudomonadota bacterium]